MSISSSLTSKSCAVSIPHLIVAIACLAPASVFAQAEVQVQMPPATIAVTTRVPPAPTRGPMTPAVADFSTCAKPQWPTESLRREETGTVTLRFLIGEDGSVKQSLVHKSSGFPLLDLAAQTGIEKCKFKPGTSNGVAREAWMQMQYVWTLEETTPQQRAAEIANLQALAEKGNADAQYQLGLAYQFGSGVARDVRKAEELLSKAALQGSVKAQQNMGVFLQGGVGGKVDLPAALGWFLKAGEQGSAYSQFMAGMMLIQGQGAPADRKEGMAWLRKAAEKGQANAQVSLGRFLWVDAGPGGDVSESIGWIEKGAAQGNRLGQRTLAEALMMGRGVPQDYTKAAKLLNEAALAGDAASNVQLAKLYEAGLGVPKDLDKAEALRKRAQQLSR